MGWAFGSDWVFQIFGYFGIYKNIEYVRVFRYFRSGSDIFRSGFSYFGSGFRIFRFWKKKKFFISHGFLYLKI